MHKYLPSFLAVAMSAFLTLAAGLVEAAGYYQVFGGGHPVTGTIRTDGTLGWIDESNILSYEITISVSILPHPGAPEPGGPVTLTKANSSFGIGFESIWATDDTLEFSHPDKFCDPFDTTCGKTFFSLSAGLWFWEGVGSGRRCGDAYRYAQCSGKWHITESEWIRPILWSTSTDRTAIARRIPDPVPLPAAMPLLVAGLGVIGFVGRRRRKSSV